MEPREIRMELTEVMLQEVLWNALSPGAIVMMQEFNNTLAQHAEMIGVAPENTPLTGVNVTFEQGKVFAELTYG